MTLFRTPLVLGAATAALLLGACATPSLETKGVAQTAAVSAAPAAPVAVTATAPATSTGTSASAVTSVDLAKSRNQPAAEGVSRAQPYVYFDFDSAVVRSEFVPNIEAHARQLLAAPDKRLRVEGHTDERGGREYNLALGQRRAESVVRSLTLLGVPETRLEAISHGAEQPKAQGDTEEAWAQNRRAALRSETPDRVAQAHPPR